MSAEKEREPISAVLSQASAPAGAVFLSYASEDAPAAQRIAETLQAASVEVWFGREELRAPVRGPATLSCGTRSG